MEGKKQKKLLLITDVTNRTLINITTLEYFLMEAGLTGVFITFDRPHQYVKKLLDINKINHDRLTFIDAISLISGENADNSNNSILFTDGPYKIPLFDDFVARSYSNNGSKSDIEISTLDFIMIDDISALSLYNSKGAVEKFINDFFTNVESLNTFIVSLALDANYNKDLYRFISKHCEKQVLVNPEKKLVIELDQKSKDSSHSSEIKKPMLSVVKSKHSQPFVKNYTNKKVVIS